MPGLSFANQNQPKRPGGWIVPVVLIVISVVLVTVSVRMGNTGAFGAVRSGLHAVSGAMQQVTSVVSTPFKAIGSSSADTNLSDDEIAALQEENEQLRILVAQLEEYRQQDQRLTALQGFSDAYGLETVSARVLSTTSGWDQTATINVGSDDGIRAGMGVMSSCGLYGQVETVAANTAVVRLISDADSSVSAMIQGTRATGIVNGSYDGSLTMEYVSVESTVGEGDIVISSGAGGTYPKGIVIGRVHSVETDSSKLYYSIQVEPISSIRNCEEVLVLTGNEDETKTIVDSDFLDQILSSVMSSTSTSDAADDSAKTGEADDKSSKSDGDGAKDDSDDTASGDDNATDDKDIASSSKKSKAKDSSSGSSGKDEAGE